MSFLLDKFNLSNPRWAVFTRIIAAIFGGYALATSSSILLGQLLGNVVGHYQAIHIGLMLTFLTYACVVMWVFSVVSAKRAWLGLLKLNLFLTVLILLLMQFTKVSS
jgi:hypothetical protein